MSATGLEVFDRTIQSTNIWLNEIVGDLGPDRNHAWRVLGAVLRSLRDQLPADLAAHLSAQLPLLIRGAFYEAWNPSDADRRAKTDDEFLAKVERNLEGTRPTNSEQAARSVFGLLSRHVDRDQVVKVRHALSAKVRRLWPETLLNDPAVRSQPTRHETIKRRAYEIWQQMGQPAGAELDNWFNAEHEVDHRSNTDINGEAARISSKARPASRQGAPRNLPRPSRSRPTSRSRTAAR